MIWWNSWSEFIAMGGYAFYVWVSFGVVFALMAGEVVLLGQRERSLMARLRQMARIAAARKGGQQ
jgi:heme exporter protein D